MTSACLTGARRARLLLVLSLVPACATPRRTPDEPRPAGASRLPDEAVPPRVGEVPGRTPPLLELGDPFLGPGPIRRGTRLPTGEVLQPSFQAFGSLRTAVQGYESGKRHSEWVSRLDLYGNLQLSGTERILVGLRPLDRDGTFSSYVFEPDADQGWREELNAEVTTAFFEGELAEILPGADPEDRHALDLGIAVGRQPVLLQDGILIDDTIDSVGITRNTLRPAGFSNLRVTALFGWNEVNRGDNRVDDSAQLFALLAEGDTRRSTLALDSVWVRDTEGESDAVYLAGSAVQRVSGFDTAIRALGSLPYHEETPEAGRGAFVFAELSRPRRASDDLTYLNLFWSPDRFSSAARDRSAGSPLGRTGILFTTPRLGGFDSALGGSSDHSAGGALGYQSFLGDDAKRRQLLLEHGGRHATDGADAGEVAVGMRYEQAIGRRLVLRFDGFLSTRDETTAGVRTELLLKL